MRLPSGLCWRLLSEDVFVLCQRAHGGRGGAAAQPAAGDAAEPPVQHLGAAAAAGGARHAAGETQPDPAGDRQQRG